MGKIILASASPRRQELLHQIGLEFDVVPSMSEERIDTTLSAEEVVKQLSFIKASDVANRVDPDRLVIGADTIVVFQHRILGKPKDRNDAVHMLKMLSGREHRVLTGFTVMHIGQHKVISDYEETFVKFMELSDEEIDSYINTGEPFDKAGAYGIQRYGSLLVEKIVGDYFNVVGLPVAKLARVLKSEFGVRIL